MTENQSPEAVFRDIEENYKRISENIADAAVKSGRKPEDIRFMAVTKTVSPIFINHALSLGIDLIGENKVQELQSKMDYFEPAAVEKHLIGHLQTNKVAKVLPLVSMIQSVDSVKLAAEIDKQAEKLGKVMPVLLEINIGGEESKTGYPASGALEFAAQTAQFRHIQVRGLMTIPPVCGSEQEVRRFFSSAHKLFVDIGSKNIDNIDMSVLSMGMSHDYREAILEGATLVRVGSALFGPRHY